MRKALSTLAAVAVLSAAAAGLFLSSGCGEEEECLAWGENCTQQYKQDNYGTTSIQCCEGQCTDHGSGVLTCGS